MPALRTSAWSQAPCAGKQESSGINGARWHNETRILNPGPDVVARTNISSGLPSIENRSKRIMNLTTRQLNLDLNDGLSGSHSAKVAAAIEKLSAATGTESRGAIFTRLEVVEFILDLSGYTEDKLLARKRLLIAG
jgi:hypothetical protein